MSLVSKFVIPDRDALRQGAQALQHSSAFETVLTKLEHDAFAAWEGTAPHDVAAREQAWTRFKQIGEIRSQIATWSKER